MPRKLNSKVRFVSWLPTPCFHKHTSHTSHTKHAIPMAIPAACYNKYLSRLMVSGDKATVFYQANYGSTVFFCRRGKTNCLVKGYKLEWRLTEFILHSCRIVSVCVEGHIIRLIFHYTNAIHREIFQLKLLVLVSVCYVIRVLIYIRLDF